MKTPKMHDPCPRRIAAATPGSRGMTLLEVIVVLSVVGLLLGAALSQIDTNPYDAASEAEQLKRSLRYAQSLAFAQAFLPTGAVQETWGLQINSGSYRLVRGTNTSQSDVNLPGARDSNNDPVSSPTHTLPPGVSVSGGTGSLYFNFQGIPCDASGATVLTSDRNITVQSNADNSYTMTVTAGTGFIP